MIGMKILNSANKKPGYIKFMCLFLKEKTKIESRSNYKKGQITFFGYICTDSSG